MLAKKFEEQVEKTPQNLAVITGNRRFTYRQFNQYANRIARQIIKQVPPGHDKNPDTNGEPNQTVALLFEHGADMLAAILGALKAGRIYVPLSTDYPPQRLTFMLEDAQTSMILCNRVTRSLALEISQTNHIPILDIDQNKHNDPATQDNENVNPSRAVRGDRIAYILYTSGSTGRPKGVYQTHENADYYNRNWIRFFDIGPTDRMTLFSSFCHDGSVQDMYSALTSGATLYPINMKNRDTDIDISDFLIQEKITIWHSVPSLFSFFAARLGEGSKTFPDLRYILLGSEPVREHEIEMLNQYFPHSTLANVYGQTESSVNSICLIQPGSESKIPSIGTPLDKTNIFVVNEEGESVAPLQTGEILIASPHIAPGYWHLPETTADLFDYDEEYGRLYWTGDLGRLRLDGSIEFLGRKDHQVKIRGFRVEPGEIESRLLEHEAIKEAIVIDRVGETGEIYLCAYYITREQEDSENLSNLRDFLSQKLPSYMVPTYFTPLEKMPLTGSGKIDRKALPQPQAAVNARYVAPANQIEETLLHIWSETLDTDQDNIGVEGSFFDYGGHSLKAVTLTEKAHKAFGVKVPLSILFKQPTVRQIAEYIKSAEKQEYVAIEPVEKKEYYPLSVNQKRMWILHEFTPETAAYNLPARFELQHEVDIQVLKPAFRDLMFRHDALRTKFAKTIDEPVQVVLPAADIPIHQEDISHLDETEQQGRRQQIFIEITETPFDLLQAPLFRVALLKLGPAHYELMFSLHHIVGDGWSLEVLRKDFTQFYEARLQGKQAQLLSLEIQYKDFVAWSNQREQGLDAAQPGESYRFWKEKILKGIPVISLPEDFSQKKDSITGAAYSYPLDTGRKHALSKLAEQHNTSLFMVMFSAYLILLSRLSKQEEVLCSIIGAGREHLALHGVVGFFVNSIIFTGQVEKTKSFSQFLQVVHENVLEYFQYQSFPVETLFAELKIRYPDVPVSFNMLNIQDVTRQVELPSFEAQHIPVVKDIKFDIEPYIAEFSNGMSMTWTYRKSLFLPGTVEYMVKEYVQILDYFARHPQEQLFAYQKKQKKKISRKG